MKLYCKAVCLILYSRDELEAFAVAVDRYLHIVVIKTSCAVEIVLLHATHRYVESQLRKHLKAYIYLTSSTIHHYNIRKTVEATYFLWRTIFFKLLLFFHAMCKAACEHLVH